MQIKKFDDFLLEETDPYLKIYKLSNREHYNFVVLKGDELYFVRIAKGEKMQWKYQGKVDRNKYVINGRLLKKEDLEGAYKRYIYIFQNNLNPTKKS